MTGEIYRFKFQDSITFSDVRDSLFVAIYAAEGLHGKAQVLLEAGIWLDEKRHSCVVDAGTVAGQSIAKVFMGLLQRQFGDDGFEVDRVTEPPAMPAIDMTEARPGQSDAQ